MISDKEYKKLLKQFHKLSDRHILVVETDMPSSDVQKVVILSDKIRKAGNELVGLMRKNYDQLMRTKKYRKLLKLYGSTKDKKKRRDLADQLNEMQKQYNVTWDHCRNAMIHIGKKYSVDAVFALTKAEDIWRGIEKCLYNNGKTIHFSKYGELPCIRAKQINRGISMSVKDNELKFKLKGNVFGIQVKDRFQTDEVCAVLEYLSRSEIINDKAINKFLDKAYCIDTYRPCYATLVPKFIRGKYRVYLHLTIEGKAKPKYDRFGDPRHKFGKGSIGADIGTQTVAYTSNIEVGLKNLSERGSSIQTSERKERLLYRAMDRSRRATNPENYNEDGTIKKHGNKKVLWNQSNHCIKYQNELKELYRKQADIRKYQHECLANYIISLGNKVYVEKMNFAGLQKRAKKTEKNDKGRFKRKKRFGKSLANKAPSMLLTIIDRKLRYYGEKLIEINTSEARASQFNHFDGTYKKKSLSQRWNDFDGLKIQRDMYSAFLIMNINDNLKSFNIDKCNERFENFYRLHNLEVERLKGKKNLSSIAI